MLVEISGWIVSTTARNRSIKRIVARRTNFKRTVRIFSLRVPDSDGVHVLLINENFDREKPIGPQGLASSSTTMKTLKFG